MIWTALILGFAGSLHCVGMCSPLATAATSLTSKTTINRLLYNLGRITMYGLLGALVSSFGFAFQLSKYQNLISLVLGITLISLGIGSVIGKSASRISLLNKLNLFLKKILSSFLSLKSYGSIFLTGVCNGLLPCGLTFAALSYAVVLSHPIEGFEFMFLFGLGTLPAMIGVASTLQWLIRRFHISPQKVITSMLFAAGFLLITRVFFIHPTHTHRLIDIVVCGM